MLKKLIKHEFKATSRFFLPAYGIFAAILVMERISMMLANSLAENDGFIGVMSRFFVGVVSFLSVLGVIAMLVSPIIYSIMRFYKNMLCDEGYLSFTLPVTVSQHLVSKLIVSCVWMIANIFVAVVLGVIFFITVDPTEVGRLFSQFTELLTTFFEYAGGWLFIAGIMLILAMLFQLITNYLSFYSAMSIGQCANKNKFLVSAGVYIAFNIAISTIIQTVVIAMSMVMSKVGFDKINQFFEQINITANAGVATCQVMSVVFAGTIVLNILLSVMYFIISKHFLTKKLNLA